MHGERGVRKRTPTSTDSMILAVESHVRLGRFLLDASWLRTMVLRILLLRTMESQFPRALGATIEARAVIIIAFSNDLTTTDDDTPMTIMKRRQRGLLKAERKIGIVARHCEGC